MDQHERQTGQEGNKGNALDTAEVDDDGGQASAERTAQLDQGTIDAEHETGFVLGHLGDTGVELQAGESGAHQPADDEEHA